MKSTDRLDRLKIAFEEFTPLMLDMYKPWTHEQPIMIDSHRIEQMRAAQLAMLKLMTFVAENYSDVCHLLQHDARVKQFLKQLQGIPFQAGTFRTDFVIDESNEMRLIEVTCRYPLNAYFKSAAMNKLCNAEKFSAGEGLSIKEVQMPILEKLNAWMSNSRQFCIVQGEDSRGNESRHLPKLLDDAGIEVLHIPLDQWRDNWKDHLTDTAIMAELTFNEWLSLPIEMVRSMLQRPFLNDPRLVFTVHDKGFFALINETNLIKKALSDKEINVLKLAFAETYLPTQAPEKWLDANENPSQWMLKPRTLGRSVNIVAGSLTPKSDWLKAINTASDNEMILQRWYQSKKITGTIEGKKFDDYFAGTLLYWGDEFFGPGMFRMSSYPISNIVDDRKATFLVDLKHNLITHPHLVWL